ncbi:hypothetical protein IQ250_04235 [Pseudanabaenaceae cyanobacterium LEGE 13415]|nr:hypothetical protein [Pseudanabaenaceae cyanobacterium LEGE 13415]
MSETTAINTRLIETLTQIISTLTDEEKEILIHQIQASQSDAQESLKQKIAIGAEQLRNGQYIEYDDVTLPNLILKIKQRRCR